MTSGLFKQFGFSPKLEAEGVKVTYAANEDESIPTFTILRLHGRNQRFMQAWNKHAGPFEKIRAAGKLSDAQALDINIKVFVDGLLAAFENIENQDGDKLSTPAEIEALFKALPDLFEDLQKRAMDAGTFQEDEIKEATKN